MQELDTSDEAYYKLIRVFKLPRQILQQALFVINFMNLPQGEILTRADKHYSEENVVPLNQPVWAKIAPEAEWESAVRFVRDRIYALIRLQDGRERWLPV